MERTIRDRLGPIDVLINNAGIIALAQWRMTLEDYSEAMQTHFWAPLRMTLAVLPEMRNGAQVASLISPPSAGECPHPLPYSASKFALTGFSEGLRAELASYGIVVTTVSRFDAHR